MPAAAESLEIVHGRDLFGAGWHVELIEKILPPVDGQTAEVLFHGRERNKPDAQARLLTAYIDDTVEVVEGW